MSYFLFISCHNATARGRDLVNLLFAVLFGFLAWGLR
jgi:hypothetical protein